MSDQIFQYSQYALSVFSFSLVSIAQGLEASMASSSNFKAMEGFAFDMTCQPNDDNYRSLNFMLPSGESAGIDRAPSLSAPNGNSLKLRIKNASKVRDEGIYSCIVNGLIASEVLVEFVSEEFINITTPNSTYLRRMENQSDEFAILIDFVALPFPKFYLAQTQVTEYDLEDSETQTMELDVAKYQTGANQLKIPGDAIKISKGNLIILANNSESTSEVAFQLVEGDGIELVQLKRRAG